MDENYAKAFGTYYSLKKQYETQNSRMKRKIANDDSLSLSEKQEAIRNMVPKCIVCKTPGGTVFKQEGMRLTARCGSEASPCGFEIDITRGGYESSGVLMEDFTWMVEEKKKQIVETKMALLFGYKGEDSALEEFERLIEEYREYEGTLARVKGDISAVTDDLEKQADIDGKEIELFEAVRSVKELVAKYKEDPQSNPGAMDSVAETVVTRISPLNQQIRDLKYSTNRVIFDEEDETYHLDQIPYQLGEIEISLQQPPVVTKFHPTK